MTIPTAVVSEQEWNAKREALLVKEKELTRARDAVAAERRRLPPALHPVRRQPAEPHPPGRARHDPGVRALPARRTQSTTTGPAWAGPTGPGTRRATISRRTSTWTSTSASTSSCATADQIYRSYYTTARAAEELSSIWALLDITPFGRQEEWQEAPEGVPQDRIGSWTRRHDEYSAEELAGGRTS